MAPIRFEFDLFSPDDESLKEAKNFVDKSLLGRHKACIVTIISKETLGDTTSQQLVDSLIKEDAAKSNRSFNIDRDRAHGRGSNRKNTDQRQPDKSPNTRKTYSDHLDNRGYDIQVRGHLDSKNGIIIMNLISHLQADQLLTIVDSLNETTESGEPDESYQLLASYWPVLEQNLIKTMLLLFVMSHIVVFYHPQPTVDFHSIHLFRVLDALRLKSQDRITDLLETIAMKQKFSQTWIRQARLSCPRALFVSSLQYVDLQMNQRDIIETKRDLEDQIYYLLKKTLFSNDPLATFADTPHAGLFYLYDRDDFVFLMTGDGDSKSESVRSNPGIASLKGQFKRSLALDSSFSQDTSISRRSGDDDPSDEDEDECDLLPVNRPGNSRSKIPVEKPQKTNSKFNLVRKFVFKHKNDIVTNSQTDNDPSQRQSSSRHSSMRTVMPRYDDFFMVMLQLKNLLFPKTEDPSEPEPMNSLDSDRLESSWYRPDERRFVDIYNLVSSEELFSKRHCYKTRLAAFNIYTCSLSPSKRNPHTIALNQAQKFYLNLARGPASEQHLELLLQSCEDHWEKHRSQFGCGSNGRRSLSSMESGPSPSRNSPRSQQIVVVRHQNGIKMVSACGCGKRNNFLITPSDRKKRLERIEVQRIND